MESYVVVKKNFSVVIILFLIFLFSCKKEDVVTELFDSQFEQFIDVRDGHVYNQITIGTQTWMAENLAYLPQVNPPDQISETSDRYYVYGYTGSDVEEATATQYYKSYGVLYNWMAASNSCPAGWHLPSGGEWDTLLAYLVDNSGGKINPDSLAFSLMAPFDWEYYFSTDSIDINNTGRNSTLFSALPSGYLYHDSLFYSEGNSAFWWSSTNLEVIDALSYILTDDNQNILQYYFNKEVGFAVRCIKD